MKSVTFSADADNKTASLIFLNQSVFIYTASVTVQIVSPLSPPQAGLTVRAVQKYLLGTDMSLFTTEHLDGGAPTQPYPSNSPVAATTETTETYQSPPFTENNAAPTYQVPIY